ncbi:hypothetical protein BC833DRAFT_587301 [Globomyces pollinis-pini]|nr:hypothetical protein BC833DRAFT_587301 [Globomyces pollinis-pini]
MIFYASITTMIAILLSYLYNNNHNHNIHPTEGYTYIKYAFAIFDKNEGVWEFTKLAEYPQLYDVSHHFDWEEIANTGGSMYMNVLPGGRKVVTPNHLPNQISHFNPIILGNFIKDIDSESSVVGPKLDSLSKEGFGIDQYLIKGDKFTVCLKKLVTIDKH